MAAAEHNGEYRGLEILLSTVIIAAISTLILIWRIVYGVKSKRKLLLCDYLLVIAAILNVSTTVIRFKTVEHGLGRHITDPSISKPDDIIDYSYYLYVNQLTNLIAVALLKYSICAYLLALKFSVIYTAVVWVSVVMVTVFVLLTPLLSNLSCTPFEANWNRAVKGKCWYKAPLGITYMQGVVNVLTDVVYVVAPILYLRSIQLPKRTQWGVRIVFLLGIVATICSIFKTVELDALRKTSDPTWDGVNLTIWSATELSVGILIASLPPLRTQFDKLLRRILPSSYAKSRTPGNSMPLYNFSNRFSQAPHTMKGADDGSSEHHILPEEGHGEGIVKTVALEITRSVPGDKAGEALEGPGAYK